MRAKYGGRKLWLPIILFILLVSALAAGTYHVLDSMTTDIVVSYINELADHDMDKICEFVSDRWEGIYGVYNELKVKKFTNAEDVQKEINIKTFVKSYDHLYLIDSEGRLYTDTHAIYDKDKNYFLEYFNSGKKEFVLRYDDKDRFHEYKKEYMLYGLNFENDPIEIPESGIKFVGLIMLNDISKIRSRMSITSFNERGYASVADMDGNYIVTAPDSAALDQFENFFDMINSSHVDSMKAEEVIKKIKGQESVDFWCEDSEGERKFVSAVPIKDLEWIFISSLDESVFDEQINQFIILITIVIVIIIVILLIVIAVFYFSQQRLKKLYDTTVKGVYNKQYYNDRLINARVSAFAIVDMDHLKYINDTYGHVAGDEVIREVAMILARNINEDGLVFRFGGDEFGIVFQDEISKGKFRLLLNAIMDDVVRARFPQYPEIKLSLSIGGYWGDGLAGQLLTKADELLYKAKETRGCIKTNMD